MFQPLLVGLVAICMRGFLLTASFFWLDLIKTIIRTVMTNTDLMWGVWSWRGPVYIGLKGDIAIKMSDIISDCPGLRTTNFDCG